MQKDDSQIPEEMARNKKLLEAKSEQYEAILEEEKLQDIRVQCVDFLEAVTSKVHAFYNTPLSNCEEEPFGTRLHADTPCCHVPVFSRCIHTTPIAGRHGESGDLVACGRDPMAAECVCPEWSRNSDYQHRDSQCVPD